MANLLERYLAGDRDRVWHELRQLGAAARDPRHRADAEAVAREAMQRARSNVTTIVERLRDQGYRFGDPHDDDGAQVPHAPPDEHTGPFVAWLEDRFGPLPMTVRAFVEIVGDVSLLGVHPRWPPGIVSDPLVVEVERKSWPSVARDRLKARAFYEDEHEAWLDRCKDGPAGPFSLDVAPDALHKANISGGQPYGVLVPDASVDGLFRFDDGVVLPFVEYLRLAFRCGGFPGLWHRDLGEAVSRSRRALAADLLEL